jgi:Predicted permeases
MFTLILVGMLAGVLGTLFGLGGGVILIPMLTIAYGLEPAEATAVSLVGIIAASTGGAAFFVKNKVSNIRLGMALEISTAIGAIIGAMLAVFVDGVWIIVIFAIVIAYSGIRMALDRKVQIEEQEDGDSFYYDMKEGREKRYTVENIKTGSLACSVAGMVSSMTGVGGGAIKVPLMNVHMKVPIKAAAATSSYMIGITAFSGAIVFFVSGQILLEYAGAVAVGSFLGALIGSVISRYIDGQSLKRYFSVLLFVISGIMLLSAGGII